MKICFLHLPKTGGTSVIRALSRVTNVLEVEPDTWQQDIVKSTSYEFIAGHAPYGIHRYISEPLEYITVLRHPAELVYSHYKYIRQHPKHMARDFANHGLDEFLKTCWQAQNNMTRILSGEGVLWRGKVTEWHYQLALDVLRQCKIVGVTSRLNNFWEALMLRYGLMAGNIGTENETERHSVKMLSEGQINAALEYNKWDYMLYLEAEKLSA